VRWDSLQLAAGSFNAVPMIIRLFKESSILLFHEKEDRLLTVLSIGP